MPQLKHRFIDCLNAANVITYQLFNAYANN